jgi:hypothetical protein
MHYARILNILEIVDWSQTGSKKLLEKNKQFLILMQLYLPTLLALKQSAEESEADLTSKTFNVSAKLVAEIEEAVKPLEPDWIRAKALSI